MRGFNTTVLYHDDADGFGSAYACWSAGGLSEATYIPVNYGEPFPDIPTDTENLFIVDFSYPREKCDELNMKYNLKIIDHHKTAKDNLAGVPYAIFDMSKSGCVLTWEYFTKEKIPDILRYVQDRDIWQWKLPMSKEINAYISTLAFDFYVWADFDREKAKVSGSAILEFQRMQIENTVKNVRMINLAGYRVPCVNASANISEIGNSLCVEHYNSPFSVSYCDRKLVKSVSLRSTGDFDVSVIARMYGGGGHKNAAGFEVSIGDTMFDFTEV